MRGEPGETEVWNSLGDVVERTNRTTFLKVEKTFALAVELMKTDERKEEKPGAEP